MPSISASGGSPFWMDPSSDWYFSSPSDRLATTTDSKWDGGFIRIRGETGTPLRRDRALWNWRSGLDDSPRCSRSSSHRMIDRTLWHIDSAWTRSARSSMRACPMTFCRSRRTSGALRDRPFVPNGSPRAFRSNELRLDAYLAKATRAASCSAVPTLMRTSPAPMVSSGEGLVRKLPSGRRMASTSAPVRSRR
jgi:hypothetical protein